VKAQALHGGDSELGVVLTELNRKHLLDLEKSESRNPEVQNRFDAMRERYQSSSADAPVMSFSGNEPKPLFHNTGQGFVDIGATMGIARREDGRGFVLVDLDNDGALDVVFHNYFRNPIVALQNRAAGDNQWIRLRLRGTKSNTFGIGAKVTVNGQFQELACGSGYLSGNAPELHYGLGRHKTGDVQIRWPSGRREEYHELPANRVYTLFEGKPEGIRGEELKRVRMEVNPGPEPETPDLDPRVALGQLRDLDGTRAPVQVGDRSTVVVFFRMGCYTCRNEMLRWKEFEKQAAELNARIVWVSIDPDPIGVLNFFRLPDAPGLTPLHWSGTHPGIETPTVFLISGEHLEKFTGRHALTAALAHAGETEK
jgi:hypothetical protein